MSPRAVPYDNFAHWYDNLVSSDPLYRDMILPNLLDLVGDVRDHQICDVACGQGWISRELAYRGALVTGVDLSRELIELAHAYERAAPLGIEYLLDDAECLDGLDSGSFNAAICSMALMNIVDLGACANAVRRILKPNGTFSIVITHPCFQTPDAEWITLSNGDAARLIRGYFNEGHWTSQNPDGVRGKIGEEHRLLSTYLNTFSRCGFDLEYAIEPQAVGERAERVPGNLEAPSVLLLRFRVAG